jgi:hypothetical protein
MNKKIVVGASILITFLLVTSLIYNVESSPLALTLFTSKEKYTIGETIKLNGTLTLSGTPVSDGLVTIQISFPNGTLWVIRTKPTGTANKTWPLEIVGATLYSGTSVRRGYYAGFNVTIRNNGIVERNYTLIVNAFYANSVPFGIAEMLIDTIGAYETRTISISSVIFIPSGAPLGEATAYFNILSKMPVSEGFVYGPEKPLTFNITGSGSGTPVSRVEEPIPSGGTYTLNLKTPSVYATLGNYTVYASTYYYPYGISSTRTFQVFLRGDITGPNGVPDGKCDIRDVALVAKAFGSFPGFPNWNPKADLYVDGKVDIKDVAIVAYDWGKIGIIG